jgi:hypothetical protein
MKRHEVLFSLVCERRRARSRPQRTRDLARRTVRATSARAGKHCSVHASTFTRPLSNVVRMWGRAPDTNPSPACVSGRVIAQCLLSIQLRRARYTCGLDADRCGQSSETTDAAPRRSGSCSDRSKRLGGNVWGERRCRRRRSSVRGDWGARRHVSQRAQVL